MYGRELARLTAAADPAVGGDETSWWEGEKLDGFALVCLGVQALDMSTALTTGEVDGLRALGADQGAQLPMPGQITAC